MVKKEMKLELKTWLVVSTNFFCYLKLSLLIAIWMKFCPGNMIITSKFDETSKFCSICTKCDHGF